jgi:hypothetical protein
VRRTGVSCNYAVYMSQTFVCSHLTSTDPASLYRGMSTDDLERLQAVRVDALQSAEGGGAPAGEEGAAVVSD